ncbi:MAG TPA: cupin domain-containing protein [Vicinamibacteria bacterium]|nr:cupin domain-containing protein [Vicinamibacteria bacterium]
MKTNTILIAIAALAVARIGFAQAPASGPTHSVIAPDAIVWGPAPPALPAGAQMAILSGDPRQAGPFTVRVRMPAAYTIPPHWHPAAEHLTILAGEAAVGMGDAIDTAAMQAMKAGAFAVMAPEMRHYLRAKAETTVQVHGTGPFTITYVNPRDDPRNAASSR